MTAAIWRLVDDLHSRSKLFATGLVTCHLANLPLVNTPAPSVYPIHCRICLVAINRYDRLGLSFAPLHHLQPISAMRITSRGAAASGAPGRGRDGGGKLVDGETAGGPVEVVVDCSCTT
jgi:hypothetical protein